MSFTPVLCVCVLSECVGGSSFWSLDDYEEYLKFFYLDILDHRYSGSDRVSKIVLKTCFTFHIKERSIDIR